MGSRQRMYRHGPSPTYTSDRVVHCPWTGRDFVRAKAPPKQSNYSSYQREEEQKRRAEQKKRDEERKQLEEEKKRDEDRKRREQEQKKRDEDRKRREQEERRRLQEDECARASGFEDAVHKERITAAVDTVCHRAERATKAGLPQVTLTVESEDGDKEEVTVSDEACVADVLAVACRKLSKPL